MDIKMIDSHIHLDMYQETKRKQLLNSLQDVSVEALIAVSNHLESAAQVLEMAASDDRIKPAIGYHPEQILPNAGETEALLTLIEDNRNDIIAIGEVGLPYYLRIDQPDLDITPYITLLEQFIQKTVALNMPIVLHAIYEDAAVACDLLEAYGVKQAHFHWFKGDDDVLARILENDYVVSITPDIVYKPAIQHIARQVPLTNLMVETDGPWPFAGPFEGRLTRPDMMHQSIAKIAEVKQIDVKHVYQQIYVTTSRFYNLELTN